MSARGTTVWDHEGKAYLDFAGGYGVFTVGHRHPRVVAAVTEQLRTDGPLRQDDVRSARGTPRAAARGDHAGRSRDLVLLEQRGRGGRGGGEARARRDRPFQDRRDRERVSRQDARIAVGQRPRLLSQRLRAVARAGRTRSVRRRRGACGRAGRRDRGLHRRTDPGRGRRQRSAAWLSVTGAPGVRRRGRAADRGRGPDRAGALRSSVRLRVRRRRSRRAHARQGAVRRRHPDRRVRRETGRLERGLRQGAADAHLDVRRQPARLRGGAGRARRAARRRARRQRARTRRRACWPARRRSPPPFRPSCGPCAARVCWSASS